eukprot:364584-Chlamydomonas_euryale.AAC.12
MRQRRPRGHPLRLRAAWHSTACPRRGCHSGEDTVCVGTPLDGAVIRVSTWRARAPPPTGLAVGRVSTPRALARPHRRGWQSGEHTACVGTPPDGAGIPVSTPREEGKRVGPCNADHGCGRLSLHRMEPSLGSVGRIMNLGICLGTWQRKPWHQEPGRVPWHPSASAATQMCSPLPPRLAVSAQ